MSKQHSKIVQAFLDAIPVKTSVAVGCQCGRLHVCRPMIEDGELDRLRADAITNNKPLIEHEEPIRNGEFGGGDIVFDCECESASRYANFLWGNRHQVAGFLRGFSEFLSADAITVIDTLPPAAEADVANGRN